MHRDITLIVLFAVMIFLFLCNFMSLGIVGDTLSKVMFGLVGFAGYFLPIFLFGVYLYYVLEVDRDPKTGAKTAAIIGLFVIFMVFAHLLSGELENGTGYDPGAMWKNSSENHSGGGVLGGTIAFILYRLLKTFGAVLVLLVAAIGCIYVIGQRSFLELFRDKAMDARLAHEERLEQREEEARYRREHPEEFEDPEDADEEDDWDAEERPRSHYEETRDRYQEIHRQRREREAAAGSGRRSRMDRSTRNAAVQKADSLNSTNVVLTDDGIESEPQAELDAPSIRGGQMAGEARKKAKILHFHGIVGDTALTADDAYAEEDPVSDAPAEAAASAPEPEGFSMPSDTLLRREEEAGEAGAGSVKDTGTGAEESSSVEDPEHAQGAAEEEREQLRDSDELHEILPEDFLDEEEEENIEESAALRGGTADAGGYPEWQKSPLPKAEEPIPATILRGEDAGKDLNSRDSEEDREMGALRSKEDIRKTDAEAPEEPAADAAAMTENAPETDSVAEDSVPEAGDPYSDLPEIHVITPEEKDEDSGAEEKDDGDTADHAADAIAIHTEREEGPSAITQALKEDARDASSSYDSASRKAAQEANASPVAGGQGDTKAVSTPAPAKREYVFPPISLLHPGKKSSADSDAELRHTAHTLQTTLENFGVKVTITDISQGPAVTRYEMLPEMGVKVSKIVSLADDIKLALAATDIRIEAPIPGKSAIGIEVPNKEAQPVALRDIIDTEEFRSQKSKIAFAVGKDIAGKPVYGDIAKMPHVLIAGATGSGKSVCINTIIMSILYHAKPEEVKLIMIDPKVVELSVYNGIPHLLIPVVTNPQKAAAALNWGVAEMEARYRHFADAKVRDIRAYNQKARAAEKTGDNPEGLHFMPQIVIIVDELADLMMVAKNDVETAICRLAQLARAAGIYLIIATQRPSVDVITGLIKANMPSRIAFRVTSGVDSRTILDMNGAEKLLGKGDMLFFPQGLPKPTRVQGCFVSDEEVNDVVQFVIDNNPITDEDSKKHQAEIDAIESGAENATGGAGASGAAADAEPEQDELFGAAGAFIIEKNNASIGLLQRRYRIGFNRAARIMDQLCDAGVVSDSEGTKSRNILMTMEQFLAYCHDNGIGVPDSV